MTTTLSFQRLEIGHKEIFQSHLPSHGLISCEFSFVNLFLWQDSYPVEWALWQDRLILSSLSQDYLFLPDPAEFSPEGLEELSRKAREMGKSGNIFFLPSSWVLKQSKDLTSLFILEDRRDYADYIYNTPTLAHLKGNKLAKRRNQINQFYKKFHHARCVPLHPEFYMEYVPLLKRWSKNKGVYEQEQIGEEEKAISRAFHFFKELELQGLVLFAETHLAGFTLFSRFNQDFGLVHFEKADIRCKGAYQLINRESARAFEQQGCPFINREQDLGIPGLRHAKESYMPEKLLETCFLYPRT